MKARRSLLSCLILAALSWSAPAAAQEAPVIAEQAVAAKAVAEKRAMPKPELHFNPFAQPDLGAPADGYAADDGRDGAWQPVLVGTLVAGRDSLANLGGIILAVDEETHGYRLEEVTPWEAVFAKDGRTLRLLVESVGAEQR